MYERFINQLKRLLTSDKNLIKRLLAHISLTTFKTEHDTRKGKGSIAD